MVTPSATRSSPKELARVSPYVEMEGNVEIGKFVRVFGFLVGDGKNFELKGNVLQNLSEVNRELYDSVKKLMSKNT